MSTHPGQSESRPKERKPWLCGDSYKFPIPKPDGDSWEILLQPYLRKHNAQCEAWKNEIHYLLLFAGLFSVVMSVFVLHSTQSLQQSSTDATISMLATMLMSNANASAGGGQTPLNQTAAAAAALIFSPSRSHVRISILWFVSLILSLATLAAGVVVLQWIREYQSYTDDIPSKEAVSVYNMRVDAWKKWRVPQIISFLPLLLLFAVVLFFAGIIVYLFTLNRTVAIAVTVIIGLTLFFLLITTLLPTIQCFVLSLSEPSRKKDIPAQCPYKSTQSWIVYWFFSWIFRYTFALGWKMRYIPIAFFVRRKDRYSSTWTAFDSWWLTLRSTYAQFIHGVFTPSSDAIDTASPGYDESRIIVYAMQNHSETSKTVLAAYHCFQEVSQTALRASTEKELDDINSSLRKRNQLLHLLYWNGVQYGRLTGASNRLDASDVQKMHDENMMLFLWLPGDKAYSDVIARGLASHMLELQTRYMQYVMVQGSLEDSYFSDDREGLWMSRIYQQYRPTHQTSRGFGAWQYALHRRISKEVAQSSVEQYVMIFDMFMRKYASDIGQVWTLKDLQTNTQGRRILEDFLSVPTILQAHLFTSSESTYSQTFRETLIFISTILETSWSYAEVHERYDFLFFSVTYMLCTLLSYSETVLQYIPIELLRGLARYESTVGTASWNTTFTGDYSIGDWITRLSRMEKSKSVDLQGTKRPLVQRSPSVDAQVLTTLPMLDLGHDMQKAGAQQMSLISPLSPLILRTESDSIYVAGGDDVAQKSTAKSLKKADSGSGVEDQVVAPKEADPTLVEVGPSESTSRFVELLDETEKNKRVDAQVVTTSDQQNVLPAETQKDDYLQSQNSQLVQSQATSGVNAMDYFGQNSQSHKVVTSSELDESRLAQQADFATDGQQQNFFNNSERFDSSLSQRVDYNAQQNQQQNFSSNSERFDSSLTQQFDYNTTNRTDMTFNNNMRSDWQEARFNSFTSSQYDTTNRNSMWMQQTHNRGESWSSRMFMDQSMRSSQAVDELGHEGVDGNLFY